VIWITEIAINFFKKSTNKEQSGNAESTFHYQQKKESVAAEVPVALVYNGISHTVMMCSPHDLADFALGFSLAEEIIQSPAEIYDIEIVPVVNGIEVHIELATRRFVLLKEKRRTLAGRTGCGICGSEQLNQVYKNLPVLDRTFTFDLMRLDDCLQQLYAAQTLGRQTGATHAAAFFTPNGELLALREDVGRHVALDKLLGWHAKQHKPTGFVLVTSRASYEMVQKSATCGIEMLIAISAATDLAVKMAQQSDLTLIGFAREGRATVYSGKARLVFA